MKKWIIAAAVLCVLAVGLVAAMLMLRGGGGGNYMHVYFYDPYARQLTAEGRPMPHGEMRLYRAVGYLRGGPGRPGALVNTWPEALAPETGYLISALKLQGPMLYAFFTPVYHEMVPLERSLFKAAFIHTMRSLPGISDITISVTLDHEFAFEMLMLQLIEPEEDYENDYEDEPELPYTPLIIYDSSHAGVLISPLTPPISPHLIHAYYTFRHLHFVDNSGIGLVVEAQVVPDVNFREEQRATHMLEVLIAGPTQEGLMTLIPPETRVIDVQFTETDIFVNLSGDFAARFMSQDLAYLMVYSIVNSLLAEFPRHIRVHFFIETELVEQFNGIEDFTRAFEMDNTRLLSYIEARRLEMEMEEDEYPEDYE